MKGKFAHGESQGEPRCKASSTDPSSGGSERHVVAFRNTQNSVKPISWTISGHWLRGVLERAAELTSDGRGMLSDLVPSIGPPIGSREV